MRTRIVNGYVGVGVQEHPGKALAAEDFLGDGVETFTGFEGVGEDWG